MRVGEVSWVSHEKRGYPDWLGYIGDDVLPSCIGNFNKPLTSLKLTFSHLKMDGWKRIGSFEKRHLFRCELLVSGGG